MTMLFCAGLIAFEVATGKKLSESSMSPPLGLMMGLGIYAMLFDALALLALVRAVARL